MQVIKRPSSFQLIRFSDCDLFGHLNNARYLDYFNNARQDHLKAAYGMDLQDYYQQGLGWLVANHDISYLRPAAFNETVYIETALLEAKENYLVVELLMMDEQQTHVKSLLWTRFVPVSIKTGRRENHSAEFMEFIRPLECDDVDVPKGTKERLATLTGALKAKQA